jgi:hypothetical protein
VSTDIADGVALDAKDLAGDNGTVEKLEVGINGPVEIGVDEGVILWDVGVLGAEEFPVGVLAAAVGDETAEPDPLDF